MNRYFDTGVLLKLYTEELESHGVREFVVSCAESIPFNQLHHAECASAVHLKVFRGECTLTQANRAMADIEEDLRQGVLRWHEPDWDATWRRCHELAQAYTAQTGCRTLDALHVACAMELGYREIVTTDGRQHALAERLGFAVRNPVN